MIPQAVVRGVSISELVAQRFPKRIPTLTLIPPSGCNGSLDIGVGGPEVPKARPGIGLDPPSWLQGGPISEVVQWFPKAVRH